MVGRGSQPAKIMKKRVGVVVVAAGESQRMGGIDKVFAPLLGEPLISHTVSVFEEHPCVSELVLVVSRGKLPMARSLVKAQGWRKVSHVCLGGRRRQDSVKLGLGRLNACEWVLVHDGARPCVDLAIIDRALEAVTITGAAVAAVPVKDTVKVVSQEGVVESTLQRDRLWAVQTPQAFRLDLLLEAYGDYCQEEVTDDAALVETAGHPVAVFMGSYENLKVTTPDDLVVAEAILSRREGKGL